MADAPKITIDSVTTFVAELPGPPLAAALGKFQGRRSGRTLAAARRISAVKTRVKIPRNLLRQLFRLTGGFDPAKLKVHTTPPPERNGGYKEILIGDLGVVMGEALCSSYGPRAWFRFRGQWVAELRVSDTYSAPWLDKAKANEAALIGVPYPPPASRATP